MSSVAQLCRQSQSAESDDQLVVLRGEASSAVHLTGRLSIEWGGIASARQNRIDPLTGVGFNSTTLKPEKALVSVLMSLLSEPVWCGCVVAVAHEAVMASMDEGWN